MPDSAPARVLRARSAGHRLRGHVGHDRRSRESRTRRASSHRGSSAWPPGRRHRGESYERTRGGRPRSPPAPAKDPTVLLAECVRRSRRPTTEPPCVRHIASSPAPGCRPANWPDSLGAALRRNARRHELAEALTHPRPLPNCHQPRSEDRPARHRGRDSVLADAWRAAGERGRPFSGPSFMCSSAASAGRSSRSKTKHTPTLWLAAEDEVRSHGGQNRTPTFRSPPARRAGSTTSSRS